MFQKITHKNIETDENQFFFWVSVYRSEKAAISSSFYINFLIIHICICWSSMPKIKPNQLQTSFFWSCINT